MSANHVNVVKDANLSEWNQETTNVAYNQYGYQKDTSGDQGSYQSYWTQYIGSTKMSWVDDIMESQSI